MKINTKRTVRAAACETICGGIIVSLPVNPQEQRCSGQGARAPKFWQWRRGRVDDGLSVCCADERSTRLWHTRDVLAHWQLSVKQGAQITDDWRRLDDVPSYGDGWTPSPSLHLHLFRSKNNNNTIKWEKNRTTRHMTDESWRSCDRGPNHSTPVLSAFSCNLLAAHQSLTSETHRSIIQFLKPSHQGRLSVHCCRWCRSPWETKMSVCSFQPSACRWYRYGRTSFILGFTLVRYSLYYYFSQITLQWLD